MTDGVRPVIRWRITKNKLLYIHTAFVSTLGQDVHHDMRTQGRNQERSRG